MARVEASAPRGILKRRVVEGETQHRRLLPDARLGELVAHFWWVSWSLREPFTTETLPHPSVHLTFESSTGMRGELGGVSTKRFVRTLSGTGHVFGVKFRPAAFQPLLGASLSTLRDRVVSAHAVFGDALRALEAELVGVRDPDDYCALAEAFLLPRRVELPPDVRATRDLVERMASDASLLRVEDAAALAELDVRALQRRFERYVGVSPKWVLMRYRLLEAVERLKGEGPPSLATLAADLGYTDQAHFARDFKAVVGRTPARFVRAEGTR